MKPLTRESRTAKLRRAEEKDYLQARLAEGPFRWPPARPAMGEVTLANSGAAGDWRLCANRKCRTLSEILGLTVGADVTTVRACMP